MEMREIVLASTPQHSIKHAPKPLTQSEVFATALQWQGNCNIKKTKTGVLHAAEKIPNNSVNQKTLMFVSLPLMAKTITLVNKNKPPQTGEIALHC